MLLQVNSIPSALSFDDRYLEPNAWSIHLPLKNLTSRPCFQTIGLIHLRDGNRAKSLSVE